MGNKKYYLYIKTSPFGLRYLGKTTKNPHTYMGSGKVWKRHIKKHNLSCEDIKTEIMFETDSEIELSNVGIELSIKYDIIKSKDWANLRNESGDGGDTSKFVDYTHPIFHLSDRAKHLNTFTSESEKKEMISKRASKIDYKNEDRLRKIKENTNWESWKVSIKNRKIDYINMKRNVVNKKPVFQLDLDNNIINEFDSITDASKAVNGSFGGIMQCVAGRNKTAFGYKWKYK
jgi:hypothetical protein